ncbi:MAG TPA: large-conductance mechanosensitive channel protein MscL [Lachnospiraceae bacterium]|nr:large-conductance mechanosensitive channel protein MscL [Lachnospiraceae bacterium]
MLKEFKAFALKGNVLDLAIGVIIGGAFGKIVASLVSDIIMPLISIFLRGVSFIDLKYVITEANGDVAEVAINYGMFIQTTIDFIIIAFSIFLFVRLITKFKRKEEEAPVIAKLSNEELLLTEIRDLLKEK